MHFAKKVISLVMSSGLFFNLLAGKDTSFTNCMGFYLEPYPYSNFKKPVFDTKQQASNDQTAFHISYDPKTTSPLSQIPTTISNPDIWDGEKYVTTTAALAAYKQGLEQPSNPEFKKLIEALIDAEQDQVYNQMLLDNIERTHQLQHYERQRAIDFARQAAEAAHLQKYGVTYDFLWAKQTGLYHIRDFGEVLRRILKIPDITHAQASAILQGYCDKRYFHGDEKQYCKDVIDLAFKHGKRLEREKKLEAEQKALQQQQKLRATYESIIKPMCKNRFRYGTISIHQTQREQALQQTLNDHGIQHVKTYELDACTQGFLLQKEINPHEFTSLSSTIFGHQLFQEAANRYRIIAKAVLEFGLQGEIVDSGVDLTQLSFESTQDGQFVLAAALSDFADHVVECSLSVLKGPILSMCNFVGMLRNPEPLIMAALHLCSMLGAGLEFANDSGTIPLSQVQLAYCQQRQMQSMQEFEQMCSLVRQQFSNWLKTSSAPDKYQAISTLVCDTVLLPTLVGKGLSCIGNVLVKGHELVFFKNAETLAQDIGISLQKAEQLLAATEASRQTLPTNTVEIESALACLMESEQLLTEIQHEVIPILEEVTDAQKIAQKIDYVNREISAKSVNAQDALERKMRALENIQRDVAKIRELSDGRMRFYKTEKLSATPGPTRGSNNVTEYNPKTGQIRLWRECYDHTGKVNRVHPKMIDGLKLKAQHYPPIKAELKSWCNKK